MIDQLDDALEQLFVQGIPITNQEVDISFEQPTRSWSSRLSRPSINIFMHDIRENASLRGLNPIYNTEYYGTSHASVSMRPVAFNIHYVITAWANEPSDEHRILSRIMAVLVRERQMPDDLLSTYLPEYTETGVQFMVAQYETKINPRDMWTVMDNEIRPSVDLIATISINPYEELIVPLVRSLDISTSATDPFSTINGNTISTSQFFTVSGTLVGAENYEQIQVMVEEIALDVAVNSLGQYVIQHMREGIYTLLITADGSEFIHEIEVPSPYSDYDFNLS
ncbi:MAG: DUF4255 domain-containing protein [Chloroflexota bacterium]